MISNIHKFREKLSAGRFCLGAGITLYDPSVTEALADSVDYVWIDLEHNPTSLESLMAHLIAARAGGVPALVRIPSHDVGWIKRVLDTGAEGIILPQSKTVEEVQGFVSACRYPPQGTRGFGPRRPTNYARRGGTEYLSHSNEHLFVAVQIETAEALDQIDRIAALPGIDSLVVGPYDLSGSFGMPGEVRHPRILDAIRTIVAAARSHGLWVGIGMGSNPAYAAEVAELGVHWAQCGNDFEYMIRYVEQLYADVRTRLKQG